MSVSSRRPASEEEPTVVQIVKPKLAVVYGRGGSGKSTGIRAFVERAQHASRDVTIADADPRATLCSYLGVSKTWGATPRAGLPDGRSVRPALRP